MLRIGVDVGGTFTDLVLLDASGGRVHFHKTPSTPSDPSEAIGRGVAEIIADNGFAPADVGFLGHGTTVATNAVIERRGALTGLLTTRGFRDVLEIGRQTRPDLYDYTIDKVAPLVRRALRLEVGGRIDADGNEIAPLDEADIAAACARLREAGVESVAIGFLHAYRNPAHEQRAAAMVAELLPGVPVSQSSDVLPEFREFERFSTTAVNAFVAPRMRRYMGRLLERVRGIGVPVEPYTVHSNGGLMSVETVKTYPVRTCLSGPAAGVVGAAAVGSAAGFPDLVTFDVGGTSTDVSLIRGGAPLFVTDRAVAGHPVRTPMIDVHVIGAGGGSIAWIDPAGALKVGPQSAGADPGPVAYGRGGTQPTLTDANIVLGRLDPAGLLGGRMTVDAALARRAIEDIVARPLGLDVETAARGIVRIAVANIARAIRSVSTERGHDIGELTLFPCGGAGPLHAVEVAEEVGCRRILVPESPGTLCARGILLADLSADYVRSAIAPADDAAWDRARTLFAGMEREADAWLAQEKVPPAGRRFLRRIEARYRGQNFEVPVLLENLEADGLAGFLTGFAAAHKAAYGYDIPGRAVEIVNCRLQAQGQVPKAPLAPSPRLGRLEDARIGRRRVVFEAPVEASLWRRDLLPTGAVVAGPAVIQEMTSTTVVPPGFAATVDAFGNLVMERAA